MKTLTVCLSSAWQQILQLNALTLNAVNRVQNARWTISGKGVNAAQAVRTLQQTVSPNIFSDFCKSNNVNNSNTFVNFNNLENLNHLNNFDNPTNSNNLNCLNPFEPSKNKNIVENRSNFPSSESVLLTFLGGAELENMKKELVEKEISLRLVETEQRTRVCTTLIDKKNKTTTELVENAKPVSSEELDQFQTLFLREVPQANGLILTGSLPENCPKDFYRSLLESLSKESPETLFNPIVCDFRGEELLKTVDFFRTFFAEKKPVSSFITAKQPFDENCSFPCSPFKSPYNQSQSPCILLKPNRDEFETTMQTHFSTEHELLEAMQVFCRDLNAGISLLITDGSRSTYWGNQHFILKFTPLPICKDEIISPIGCGDSLTGAVLWAMTSFFNIPASNISDSNISASNIPNSNTSNFRILQELDETNFLSEKQTFLLHAIQIGMGAAAENLVRLDSGVLNAESVLRRAQKIPVVKVR